MAAPAWLLDIAEKLFAIGTLEAEQTLEWLGPEDGSIPPTALTGMTFPVEANALYDFKIYVQASRSLAGTAPGVTLTVPAGASYGMIWTGDAATTLDDILEIEASSAPNIKQCWVLGRLQTGGTAGTVQVMMEDARGDAAAPHSFTFYTPSYILAQRIA